MNNNSKLLLALIGAVLITSGCMEGGESEASTSALAVNQFDISPNPAPGGQSVSMQMQLENAGDVEATDVTASVFGPTFGDDSRTWTADDGTTMDFNNLQPATDTQPAIPQQSTLTFTTPGLERGRNLPYDFNAEIFYGYETSSSTSIQVMSQERYQETNTVQSSTTVDNSNAPIQLDVQGSTPIVFQPQQGQRTEDLCITVTNAGTGTPFYPDALPVQDSSDVNDEEENRVQVEIEDVGNIVFTENEANVEIIGTEGFHCFEMTAAGLGDATQLEQTANIEIESRYGYREETSTSVTVEGRGTGSTGGSGGSSNDGGSGDDSNEGPGAPPTPGDQ